jgi:hypothetical protein
MTTKPNPEFVRRCIEEFVPKDRLPNAKLYQFGKPLLDATRWKLAADRNRHLMAMLDVERRGGSWEVEVAWRRAVDQQVALDALFEASMRR